MALLLDTCIYLWILDDSERLDAEARAYLNRAYPRHVSAVSFAEIEIKRSIGKLSLPDDYREQLDDIGLSALAYTMDDSAKLGGLAFHHKDPFDRMLIAQAIARDLTIVTADPVFQQYPVRVRLVG